MKSYSRSINKLLLFTGSFIIGATSSHAAGLQLAEAPLFLRDQTFPNVMINLSVETPMGGAAYNDQPNDDTGCGGRESVTVTVSNADGSTETKTINVGTCYFPNETYLGHFDSDKCYTYVNAPTVWTIEGKDSEELNGENGAAINAIDGNTNTIWHTEWDNSDPPHPHYIEIDLGQTEEVTGFIYTPRDNNGNGTIDGYKIYVETNSLSNALGSNPINDNVLNGRTPVASGNFDYSNYSEQTITFASSKQGRYVTLVSYSALGSKVWASAAEVTPIVNSPSSDYFKPVSLASATHTCDGSQWSGNFLNWSTMTAMDAFIHTMTGGNRISDTISETILRRARKHNNNNWFPTKRTYTDANGNGNVIPSSVTPYSAGTLDIDNTDFGFDAYSVDADGNKTLLDSFTVAVSVCDSNISGIPTLEDALEENCVAYTDSQGNVYYKPEGLIQEQANNMRFSVIGYAFDSDIQRHGGVLRANSKHVGPNNPDGSLNAIAEYGEDGILIKDPENLTSQAGVDYSGIINYINKFSDYGYKVYDPVSELFYETIRYFKNLDPTPEYHTNLSAAEHGGFPVITQWDDPIQHECQSNFIVAINDAYPWRDKRLPYTHFTCDLGDDYPGNSLAQDCGQPSNPDTDINVRELTNEVGSMQRIGNNLGERLAPAVACTSSSCSTSANGRENSYYLAGLAYYANTEDLRSESSLPGEQTITTFMIDTQEYQSSPLIGQYNPLWLTGKYGGFYDENGDDTPDLEEWDANGDGEPDNYVLVSQPEDMINALSNAFNTIEDTVGTASAVSFEAASLAANNHLFQAIFNTLNWTGNLKSIAINADGTLGATAWETDQAGRFPAEPNREIFTWDNEATIPEGIEFKWSDVNSTQQGHLNNDENLLDYLRGDDSNEIDPINGTGVFRIRYGLMGDIVNSSPVFVGESNLPYTLLPGDEGADYASFSPQSNRRKMVYVGANDGMMHAFDADTGIERFVYVPNKIFPELKHLANPIYAHQYYVNGPLHAGDAYDVNNNNAWSTILVGALGAGGRALFAMDITDPDDFDENDILWETTNADISHLGFVYGEPQIARLNNGRWAVVTANGYNSDEQSAVLIIKFLDDGSVITLDTEANLVNTGESNGLGEPLLVDINRDLTVDYVYAGDLLGNVWKFDLSTADSSQWDVAFKSGDTPLPLFVAKDGSNVVQPITSRPAITNNPAGGYVIIVGTGRYFVEGDQLAASSPQVQTLYGIHDDGAVVSSLRDSNGVFPNLVEQTIDYQGAFNGDADIQVRVVSDNTVDYAQNDGWYLDLVAPGTNGQGEMIITRPSVRNKRVILTTFVPSQEICDPETSSWFMEIGAIDGSRSDEVFIDVTDDGHFDQADEVTISNGVDVPVTGLSIGGTVADLANVCQDGDCGVEYAYANTVEGNLERIRRKGVPGALGRHSWLQLK